MRRITLIAGPTASGKSALALRLAEGQGAQIINTDSMQVYDVLRVLTARPSDAELARVPHHLYGHVSPADAYSTGRWARDVMAVLRGMEPDTPLIFVGGTGLYFRALTEGLAPMPPIDPFIRRRLRDRLASQGAPALHAELRARDQPSAEQFQPADGQRIMRALEVLEASGRSIRWWQSQPRKALVEAEQIADRWLLMPGRDSLRDRIADRFEAMIEAGALDEVARLRAMKIDPDLPAMKAIGVRELVAVLDGRMTTSQAMDKAKVATSQYAKRQATWWRKAADRNWRLVECPESEQ